MKRVIFINLIIILTVLCSCITMPGDVIYTESKTDNVKQLSVDPGWLYDAQVKIGVYKTSNMLKENAILVVLSKDTISFKKSLFINIDGEKNEFESFDNLSLLEKDISDLMWFKKRYEISLNYLIKMTKGKSVWIRVDSQNGTFIEGEFKDGITTAKRGFIKFLEQIDLKSGEILPKSKKLM